MKKNMGSIDKVLRVLIAVSIILLYGYGILSGVLGLSLIVLALVFLITGFIGFCPLYTLFGWSSKSKGKQDVI